MAVCAKCIFLADGHHPVLLRVDLDGRLATIHQVKKNLTKKMKLTMTNALMTHEGRIIDMNTCLSDLPNNAAIVIHDTVIPDTYARHGGRLWECARCGKSYTRQEKFKNNA